MSSRNEQRRMVENEAIFRKFNERVKKGYDNLKKIAKDQDWQEEVEQGDHELYFYCECSNEDCKERILIKPSRYNAIHLERDKFIVICGHEAPEIEMIIKNEVNYCITQKFTAPPESPEDLHRTHLSNE